ncbi:ABC transporter permease [Natrononativus amylolyticus]|uniref:ABC transporter permease n=1 Tax=Natrononativus amylolyticus TaxID=2963434 RepID=UPI0020CF47B8|nr:ABC transporter permease [Natrononativus amylolyticus]
MATTPESHDHASAERLSSRVHLRQAAAFTERSLREVGNSWTMLLTIVALAPGMQLLYTSQGGGMSPATIASWAIGTGVFGAIYVCLYVFGYQLSSDLEDRRYAAYRSMPISPVAELSGRMLAGLALAATTFALTLGAGAATGGSFGLRGLESVPVVVLAFALTCAVWMIVAVPFVVYAKNERVAEYAVPLIAIAGYILTGFNGVVAEMSFVDGDALNYLPNTLPTRVLVYHLVPDADWTAIGAAPPAAPAGPEYVALLVIYAAVALAIGAVLFNRVLYERGWW